MCHILARGTHLQRFVSYFISKIKMTVYRATGVGTRSSRHQYLCIDKHYATMQENYGFETVLGTEKANQSLVYFGKWEKRV